MIGNRDKNESPREFLGKNLLFFLSTAGIIIVFFFLRLYQLTILPIFADEAIYIRWAQVMRAEPTLRFLPLSDGKQPLFMWLVIPFLKFFADPLFAGRLVSVISGFLGMIGAMMIVWELVKNRRLFLLTGFFFAIIPFAVFSDRLALVDSLLAAFGIWSAYLSVLLAKNPRLDLALIAGGVLAGGLLTKSPALFFAFLLPAGLIFLSVFREIPKAVSLLMIVWSLGFGIYNFLLRLGPGFQMIAVRNKDYVFGLEEILSHPLDPLLPHLADLTDWFPNLLTWPIFVLVLAGSFLMLKKNRRAGIFLLLWSLPPLLVQSVMARVFTPRYLLFTIWPLLIFAAYGLESLIIRISGRLKYLEIALVLVFVISFPAFFYDYWLLVNPAKSPLPRNLRSGHLEEWTAGQGIKEAANYFRQESLKTNILVGTEGFFGTLPDGLQIFLNQTPRVTVIGVGYPITGVSDKLINSLVDNRVFLLVNKSRLMIKPQNYGLNLIEEYPKEERPDGERDALLLFEVNREFWQKKSPHG